MTDVLDSVRFIKQKNKSGQSSDMITPTISMTKNNKNIENDISYQESTEQKNIKSGNIEQVHNTVDTGDFDNNIEDVTTFDTLDCDLSEDISFVLTRNIVICHNDKEY